MAGLEVRKNVLKNSAMFTYVARALGLGLNVCLSVAVARVMPPEESGKFFILYAISLGASLVAKFGTDFLALRLSHSSDSLGSDAKFLNQIILIAFAGVIAPIGVISIIYFNAIGVDNPLGGLGFELALLAALPMAVLATLGALLRATGAMVIGTFLETGAPSLVAMVFLLVLIPLRPNSQLAILCVLVGASLTTVIAILATRKQLNHVHMSGNRSTLKIFISQHFRQLLGTAASAQLLYIWSFIPLALLFWLSSADEVAFYSVAIRLASIMVLIPSIQIVATGPIAAKYPLDHLPGPINQHLLRNVRVAVASLVPVAAILVLIPGRVLSVIFGDEYVSAAPALVVLVMSATLSLLAGNSLQVVQIIGRHKFALSIALLGLAPWLLLSWRLVPSLGALGASLCWAMSILVTSFGSAVYLRRTSGLVTDIFTRKGRSGQLL